MAAAFADVADLKSPFTLGHSSRRRELARDAGGRLGLDDAARDRLEVAGLLHDLGRVGVSDADLGAPGAARAAQWEQVRLHAYHSERILARSAVARADGRARRDAPRAARRLRLPPRLGGARDPGRRRAILAAADAFQAMTQDAAPSGRPAARGRRGRVRDDVRAGRLDGDAAAAVLEAAGQARAHVRARRPAGLSEREVEVLRAVARGLTNREIAERSRHLAADGRAPRPAHLRQDRRSSRAAAALFAMEHDLLDR